jgi:hypothetical protein
VGQFRPFAYIRFYVGSPKAVSRPLLPRDRRLSHRRSYRRAMTLELVHYRSVRPTDENTQAGDEFGQLTASYEHALAELKTELEEG